MPFDFIENNLVDSKVFAIPFRISVVINAWIVCCAYKLKVKMVLLQLYLKNNDLVA